MDTDKNYDSHVNEKGVLILPLNWEAPSNPLEWDDVLKFSNCEDITVVGLTIPGGTEEAVDAVRGSNYQFVGLTLIANGQGSMCLKGSIDGYLVHDCEVENGTDYGIELGQFDNYWYPGRKPTRNGKLSQVRSPDGKQVLVKLYDAEVPEIENSCVQIKKVPVLIWYPYFLFQYCLRKLTLGASSVRTKIGSLLARL